MSSNVTITREVAAAPARATDAHKGDVGRVVIIGGSGGEVAMAGAPSLAAGGAFRSGAGLVQLMVPLAIRDVVASLAPSATVRALPTDADAIVEALEDFRADVLAIGPGLQDSISPSTLLQVVAQFEKTTVIDADGLNLLASLEKPQILNPERVILTPHPGEGQRLLRAHGLPDGIGSDSTQRREAACGLAQAFGCSVVLKGAGTVVTDGQRLYVNETGNSGMATGGMGDVLTGVIAALLGQGMEPLEASILGVYLHGLAGDFAAEELGRWSTTAMDVIDFLPEAFCEHALRGTE